MKSIKDLSQNPSMSDNNCKWIVEGIIKKGKINTLFADPACGKTQLIVHMVTAISDGKDFLGHKTNKCRILIISTEASYDDMYERFQKAGLKNTDNVVLDCDNDITPMNLGFKASEYDLVVIDVLVDYFSQCVTDQNNYSDVYNVFSNLRKSTLLKDCTIILVSHLNKKGLPMGSQAFLAAADTRMFMYAPSGITSPFRKLKWYGKQVKPQELNILFSFEKLEITNTDLSEKSVQFNVILAIVINYVNQVRTVEESASTLISKLSLHKLGCFETNLTKILNDNIETLNDNGIKLTVGRKHKGRYIKLECVDDVTGDSEITATPVKED